MTIGRARRDDHEFEQTVAEALAKLGREPVYAAVKAVAAEFGWPLSPAGRTALLYQLATRCRGR